jgi:hypothetical protein
MLGAVIFFALVAVCTDWHPYDHIVFPDPDEEFVYPIIPVQMEDDGVHTAENGYCCGDPTCYCASASVESTEEDEE